MVLDEVAQRAGVVVVARARADAEILRRRDLDVVDVVAVPQRLEHAVGEAQRQHVLDGLLAEVVVDAEDLALLEHRQHDLVELARLGQARAERLLDDHADLGVLRVVEVVRAELLDDDREELRRGREVEAAVQRLAGLLVDLRQHRREALVDRVVVERPADVARALEELREHLLVGRAARELADGARRELPELVVGEVRARAADEREVLGQRALVGEVVERGQELAAREVAGRAEDHERRGVDRQALEPGGEGVGLLGEWCHPSADFLVAWPPNWARSAASMRCVKSPLPRL